ncbi:hypothetical protein FRC01_001238 [Tulasnella sp. 417]|nr:hypothetical protein FRC01_001238 [Tulasnella sp. 417]
MDENSRDGPISTASNKRKYGDDAYVRKKPKSKHDKSEQDSWRDKITSYGRCITRNADGFSLPRFVINVGLEMEANEDEDEDEDEADEEEDGSPLYSVEERIWRSSYLKYKQCFPELLTTLVNQEQKSYITKDSVERLLWKGMMAARQTDVHLIKTEIHKYYDFQPGITNVLKASLGYSHPATGMLLCPANLIWDDESVQENLRRGEDSPNVDTLFYFMYSNYSPSPNSLNRGLLRSPILIKAYKAVFFGPSSATAQPTGAGIRSKKAGNAVLGGITQVTPSAIAYITCIVRFALSSEPHFQPASLHGFDNCGFYRALIQMLEGPNPSAVRQRWRTELLEWWNLQCFPKTTVPTTSSGISLQELLLAQEAEEEVAMEESG